MKNPETDWVYLQNKITELQIKLHQRSTQIADLKHRLKKLNEKASNYIVFVSSTGQYDKFMKWQLR